MELLEFKPRTVGIMKKILINKSLDERVNISKIRTNLGLKFLEFLRDKGVLKEFLDNFFDNPGFRRGVYRPSGCEAYTNSMRVITPPDEMLNDIHYYLNKFNEAEYILNAFSYRWCNVERGQDYWPKLDDEWQRFVFSYWGIEYREP